MRAIPIPVAVLGLLASQPAIAPAQVRVPAGGVNLQPSLGPVTAVGPTTCGSGGGAGPDLTVVSVGFDPSRHVVFTVANCGRSATPLPFVSDVFIGSDRRDTAKEPVLPGRSMQTVMSTLAHDDSCASVSVRVTADAQNVIAEDNESNNQRSVQLVPACPDLVVDEIKQDLTDANTRYTVQIKVANHGDGPSTVPVTVHAQVAEALGGVPDLQSPTVPPLAPGQSYIFHLNGKHLVSSTVDVDLFVDYYRQVVESNEQNNVSHKTLGPH